MERPLGPTRTSCPRQLQAPAYNRRMSDWNNNTGPDVPPPPTPPPTGQVFLPPTQPVYQGTPGGPTYSPPGGTTLQPGPSPDPKRSRGKMVGALVGVLALVGAGTFAV